MTRLLNLCLTLSLKSFLLVYSKVNQTGMRIASRVATRTHALICGIAAKIASAGKSHEHSISTFTHILKFYNPSFCFSLVIYTPIILPTMIAICPSFRSPVYDEKRQVTRCCSSSETCNFLGAHKDSKNVTSVHTSLILQVMRYLIYPYAGSI